MTRFATGALGAVDLRVAADGSLFYLARDASSVFRVIFTANTAPSITTQPQNQTVPVGGSATFTVSAAGSTPLSFQWQRAEAGTSTWVNIAGATSTTFTLTNAQTSDNGDQFRTVVTNAFGTATSSSATLTVTSNQAPSATISIDSGLTNGRFIAGQAINFSGTATDPQDGTLPASSFTWKVEYITSINSGNPAVRPFVPEFSGQTSGVFTPDTTGPCTLTDVAYRVTQTVTDSGGLSTTVTRDVLPNTATLTVTTSPTGLQVTVDGQPFTAPRTFDSVAGFQRPIGAAASQTLNGTTYNFVSWSDGGSATHTISTPLANTTYTATYQPAPVQGVNVKVNFQDGTSQGFSGYLADTGAVFGNRAGGFSYGWNLNNSSTARNRNSTNSPDERYDTLQHMQKPANPNAVWEISVPNGTYRVRVVSGDPGFTDSVYRTNIEGVLAINGTPTTANRWFEGIVTVNVTTVGVHTLNLWMREDGFVVDKILLTSNASFTPTGVGPAESPRGSGAAALSAAPQTTSQGNSGNQPQPQSGDRLSEEARELLRRLIARLQEGGSLQRRLARLLERFLL
ncbi:MAG: immunoglobulin domain-containing protein [Gemmataceae bacterium]|nr:immunoglobulin domain-containing protein [Gemmataceae bacterium]